MKYSEISKSKANRIVAILVVFFALLIYQFWGDTGRAIFRPQTFCHQAEADAYSISSAVSDYISIPENQGITPTEGDIEMIVDVESPWTLTVCGRRFFINVIDRSGKCPVEYQNQYKEWNSNIYMLEF
jgi:hypothetical protein